MTRLLLLAAALLMVVGGGLPVLHLASHRHAICPEHGELVDVTDAHSVDHSGHVKASHVDPDKGDAAGHVHCGVLATLSQSSLRTPAPALIATPPKLVTTRRALRRVRQPAIAPLSRAPKTSPPA